MSKRMTEDELQEKTCEVFYRVGMLDVCKYIRVSALHYAPVAFAKELVKILDHVEETVIDVLVEDRFRPKTEEAERSKP